MGNEDTHSVTLTKTVYIDRSDFRESANKKYYGMTPGKDVFLKYAYNVKCVDVVKNDAGDVTELKCEVDLSTRAPKVKKGFLTWVSNPRSVEFRIYDVLFNAKEPGIDSKTREEVNWLDQLNRYSEVIKRGYVDEYVVECGREHFQFRGLAISAWTRMVQRINL